MGDFKSVCAAGDFQKMAARYREDVCDQGMTFRIDINHENCHGLFPSGSASLASPEKYPFHRSGRMFVGTLSIILGKT